MLTVANGDWGGARPEDIDAIARSVMSLHDIAGIEPIRVEPTASPTDRPCCAFDRTDAGEVRVFLSVRGSYWAWLVYEFAHEVTHVLANTRERPNKPMQWLEECLCEANALYSLERLSTKWLVQPPFEAVRDYAPALKRYADETAGSPTTVSTFIGARLHGFLHEPEARAALRHLNRWTREPATLTGYFASWRASAPSELHGAITAAERSVVAALH